MNEYTSVVCPACGRENHISIESEITDASCEFCHTSLNPETEQQKAAPVAAPKPQYVNPNSLPYSSARPFWYVALMVIMTMGIYNIGWFYRGWKVLLEHYKLKGSAGVNAVFAPYCCWSFFRYAFSYGELGGYKLAIPSNLNAALYFIFTIVGNILSRVSSVIADKSPFEAGILNLLALSTLFLILIPIRQGVNAMNAGIAKLQPNTRMRTTLSPVSIIFVVIGSIVWLLIILGLLGIFGVIPLDIKNN